MSRAQTGTALLAAAVALVSGFEGLRNYAYRDPVGIPTICFGETRGVHMGDYKTTQEGKAHRFEEFRPKMTALLEIIAGPDASARSRVRATAALFGVSASCMFFMPDSLGPDSDAKDITPTLQPLPDREELRKIVLELADDLTHDIA